MIYEDQVPEQDNEMTLDQELVQCKLDLAATKDTVLRITADFDNYKKRMIKEQNQWSFSAKSDILLNILPIVDDFDRAFTQGSYATDASVKTFLDGFEMIYKAFQKFLKHYDVQEIPTTTEFNPELHEAIAQVDMPDKESGTIIEVVEKGYTYKGQLLRPAKVAVAK